MGFESPSTLSPLHQLPSLWDPPCSGTQRLEWVGCAGTSPCPAWREGNLLYPSSLPSKPPFWALPSPGTSQAAKEE